MAYVKKFLIIVGARPNFIKVAPLLQEIAKYQNIKPILVHTGQHYDYKMSQIFFQELNIPQPNYNLEVGSASHAQQTAKIISRLEPVFLKEKPDLIIVIGDVNSTLAGALTAAKLQIPVAHIEAGLRSFDMTMPEEINRRLTDHLSSFLFVSEDTGVKNLLREGIASNKIYLVGDILIDALKNSKLKIQSSKFKRTKALKQLNLRPKSYAVLTLHRPTNVDNPKTLKKLLKSFSIIQKKIPIIFPVHPRTQKKIPSDTGLFCLAPLGYLDFLALISQAKFVLTDSGGLQTETTFLGVPCLTLRETTEKPLTVEQGTNILCGTNQQKIIKEVDKILGGQAKKGQRLELWDGKTTQRIIKILNR